MDLDELDADAWTLAFVQAYYLCIVFMRILIATGLYAPDIGGPATYTKFLEIHLPPHGIEVRVVPFTYVRKYPRVLRHLVYFFKLLRAVRGTDVVYALDAVSVGVPAMICARFFRKKFILRVPGDYAWEQGSVRFGVTETLDTFLIKKQVSFFVRALSRVQTWVAQNAYHIVVPSDYMKRVVGMWGITPSKITRIYSALHIDEVTEKRDVLRARYQYADIIVTSAGRLVPWKGMDMLIDVVATLRNQGVPVSLQIIGGGVLQATLQEKIDRLQAKEYIELLGNRSTKELYERVVASDVFVLNTSYEGLSHQLLEVMYLGTPIVTTSVGGNVEVIRNREEGLLVPYNDHAQLVSTIQEMTADTPLREHCVQKAKHRTRMFEERVIVDEVVSFLKGIHQV